MHRQLWLNIFLPRLEENEVQAEQNGDFNEVARLGYEAEALKDKFRSFVALKGGKIILSRPNKYVMQLPSQAMEEFEQIVTGYSTSIDQPIAVGIGFELDDATKALQKSIKTDTFEFYDAKDPFYLPKEEKLLNEIADKQPTEEKQAPKSLTIEESVAGREEYLNALAGAQMDLMQSSMPSPQDQMAAQQQAQMQPAPQEEAQKAEDKVELDASKSEVKPEDPRVKIAGLLATIKMHMPEIVAMQSRSPEAFKSVMRVIDKMLKVAKSVKEDGFEILTKAKVKKKSRLKLAIGTIKDGKIKVRDPATGKSRWRGIRTGMMPSVGGEVISTKVHNSQSTGNEMGKAELQKDELENLLSEKDAHAAESWSDDMWDKWVESQVKNHKARLTKSLKKSMPPRRKFNPEILSVEPTHYHNGTPVKIFPKTKGYNNLKEASYSAEIMDGEHKGKYTTVSEKNLKPYTKLSVVKQELEKSKNVREQRKKVFGSSATPSKDSPFSQKMMDHITRYAENRYGIPVVRSPGKLNANGKMIDKPDLSDSEIQHIGTPASLLHEIAHIETMKDSGMPLSHWQKWADKRWGEINSQYGYKQQAREAEEYESHGAENKLRRQLGLPIRTRPTREASKERLYAVDRPDKQIAMDVPAGDRTRRIIALSTNLDQRKPQFDRRQEGIETFVPNEGWMDSSSPDAIINRRAAGDSLGALRLLRAKRNARLGKSEDGGPVQGWIKDYNSWQPLSDDFLNDREPLKDYDLVNLNNHIDFSSHIVDSTDSEDILNYHSNYLDKILNRLEGSYKLALERESVSPTAPKQSKSVQSVTPKNRPTYLKLVKKEMKDPHPLKSHINKKVKKYNNDIYTITDIKTTKGKHFVKVKKDGFNGHQNHPDMGGKWSLWQHASYFKPFEG